MKRSLGSLLWIKFNLTGLCLLTHQSLLKILFLTERPTPGNIKETDVTVQQG